MNFRLARDHIVHLETAHIFCPSRHQANNFFAVCSIFESEGVTNLMSGRMGNITVFPYSKSLTAYSQQIKAQAVWPTFHKL